MTSSRMASSSRPMSSRSSGVRCSRSVRGHGGVLGQRSISTGPAAAETHVRTIWPSACWTSPVRRSRTAPEHRRPMQELQMPMRQPCGSSAPACSPATSSGVVAVRLDLLAAGQEADAAAVAADARRGGDRAGSARGAGARGRRRARSGRSARRAGRPARTPRSGARASRARAGRAPRRPSGRRGRRGARAACSRSWPRASARSSPPKIVSSADGATCTCATSGKPRRAARERAQHAHHRRDAAAGRHEQQRLLDDRPAARTPRSAARAGPACRGARGSTRCSDTRPPGMRLTVMAMRPSRRRGSDVSE